MEKRLFSQIEHVVHRRRKVHSPVWNHTSLLLQEIQNRKSSYAVRVHDVDIIVFPGVFPPTTESRLLAEYIHLQPGDRFLDLTTGSGVAAIIAGLQGATGIAVDINATAVRNARANFTTHKLSIETIESNLFSHVPNEKFDVILCNPPYYDGPVSTPLDYAVFGGKEFIAGLLKGLPSYLKPTGKALITYATWSENSALFEEQVRRHNLLYEIISMKKSDDGQRQYNLYEIRLRE